MTQMNNHDWIRSFSLTTCVLHCVILHTQLILINMIMKIFASVQKMSILMTTVKFVCVISSFNTYICSSQQVTSNYSQIIDNKEMLAYLSQRKYLPNCSLNTKLPGSLHMTSSAMHGDQINKYIRTYIYIYIRLTKLL